MRSFIGSLCLLWVLLVGLYWFCVQIIFVAEFLTGNTVVDLSAAWWISSMEFNRETLPVLFRGTFASLFYFASAMVLFVNTDKGKEFLAIFWVFGVLLSQMPAPIEWIAAHSLLIMCMYICLIVRESRLLVPRTRERKRAESVLLFESPEYSRTR